MSYNSGFRKDRIAILNRTSATIGEYGVDSTGAEWEQVGEVWASVDWVKGKSAMSQGALDVYAMVMVRCNYNDLLQCRSRVVHDGTTYQIVPETFHASKHDNTIQFHAQAIIGDSQMSKPQTQNEP